MNLSLDPKLIKGFLDHKEGEALYHLAKECSSIGPLLEIGSYCGKSALYIGQAAKECRQILYSVDHHQGSEEQQPGEAYHDPDLLNEEGNGINTLPFFLETIRLAGLQNHVIPIVSSSEKAAKNLQKELSFIFIDGGHSRDAAFNDYKNWMKKLLKGGILAIHDIFPDPKDGGRPPYEIYCLAKNSGLFEELPMVKSLGILKSCTPGILES